MNLSIINPANGQQICNIETDNQLTINTKYNKLKAGQLVWAEASLAFRTKIIIEFAELLAANFEELAAKLTSEVGKPIIQAKNEINGGINRINWMVNNAEKYLANEIMHQEETLTEKIVYEPLGIIGNISAWNYPYLVGINVIIPALLAGNAVFYKPSEFATLTGLAIQKLLYKAGIPQNVFEIAIGKGDIGAELVELPLDGYFFTGSYATGQIIYEKVAKKMVPCQLELGGKDPLYITNDIENIKNVAIGTADGAFYNNGQSCCAVERIYVQEEVYDEYLKYFTEEIKSWKIGLPISDGVYIGALTRPAQIEVLERQVKNAIEGGAIVITGGNKLEIPGNYFEPTVIVNVKNNMDLMQEESFGPIIGIMKVQNDEEAITLMNDTKYGLTAAVYSKSYERAESILKQINTGTGYWNCCDRVSAALPWSGRKQSGFGATLSEVGLRAFTKIKAYHLRG
jgi:acyl-CoA reductase-like NAD-dependent aldehyde dehydrogenase